MKKVLVVVSILAAVQSQESKPPHPEIVEKDNSVTEGEPKPKSNNGGKPCNDDHDADFTDSHFDGSDLSEHFKKWFSGSGSGHHRWVHNWRHHHHDGDDHDDDDHHNRHRRDGGRRHNRFHHFGDDHHNRNRRDGGRRHNRFHHFGDDHHNRNRRDGGRRRNRFYHHSKENIFQNEGPLTFSFPVLFSQPVEAVGASIQKLNEITATVAAKFDFLQEIRIMFACPAKSCLYGCPETEELRMQAGCIEPRKAGVLQAGAGESIVAVEVVVASMPTPADIKLLLEMLQNANLMPLMEPTDVMSIIVEEEENNYHGYHHRHQHHCYFKIACILTVVVLLGCTCCKKRRAKRAMKAKAEAEAASKADLEKGCESEESIPVSEEVMLKGSFVFDPVVKPTEEVVVGEVTEPAQI